MSVLHLPWLELSILIPLFGAIWVGRVRDAERARRLSIVFKSLVLLCTVGAWQDFTGLHTFEAHDRWDFVSQALGDEVLVIDELSAPLLPLAALLYLATAVATMRTKVKRFSFPHSLASEALLLATFSCRDPRGVIALLAAGTILPFLELRSRKKPTRVYVLHMGLCVGLLVAGQALLGAAASSSVLTIVAVSLLTAAVLIRSGVFPLHVWMRAGRKLETLLGICIVIQTCIFDGTLERCPSCGVRRLGHRRLVHRCLPSIPACCHHDGYPPSPAPATPTFEPT